jgi:FMN reductase
MASKSIVGISGNLARPSRTRVLVEAVLTEAASRGFGAPTLYDLADAGPELGGATGRKDAPADLDRVWSAIEGCDALVVGSPVYKGSYAGLLKHLFDFLDMKALAGKPVILTATARADGHALMIDHQFRPLFAFFGAFTLPQGIYATDADFAAPDKLADGAQAKVSIAVDQLRALIG